MGMNVVLTGIQEDGSGNKTELTDSSGNSAGNVILNSGAAQNVAPEHVSDSGSTTNIVAAAPVEITGLSVYGFPYESVTFTRTAATGDVGLVWSVSTSNVFMFKLSWSAGSDAVNITATTAGGDDFGNIPHNIAGTVAVTAITANSTGTLYIG